MFKKQKLKVVEQIEQNINDAMTDMQSGTWSGANGKEHCDLYISGLRHALHCADMVREAIKGNNL